MCHATARCLPLERAEHGRVVALVEVEVVRDRHDFLPPVLRTRGTGAYVRADRAHAARARE